MRIYYKNKCINSKLKNRKVVTKTKEPALKLIARYKFDKSIYNNLIPEFNPEFTSYEIVDKYLDTEDIVTTSTETMMIMNYDTEPDEYGILTTKYEVENVSTFSAENIVTRSIYSEDLPTIVSFGYSHKAAENDVLCLIELSYLNTNNINDMNHLFANCHNLIKINTKGWDISKVTDMSYMFYTCRNLTSLDLSNFDTSNIINMRFMFNNCPLLNNVSMNNSDYNSVNKIIEQLPTRTADNPGVLDITGIDDINQVDIGTAQAKYWNIITHFVLGKSKLGQGKLTKYWNIILGKSKLGQDKLK